MLHSLRKVQDEVVLIKIGDVKEQNIIQDFVNSL
jgi:hypothetical protein